MKNRKAIALAADFGYQEQVKTIIRLPAKLKS